MTTNFRVGHGYDVHRLTEGRPLILGGVRIEFEKGLLGHSDADVLTHAIMDAILGAAALPDIGQLFPDTDEQYHNADSIALLREVREYLSRAGYAVANLDATVIAQRPKIAGYKAAMINNIADALKIASDQINIKATTEEHLGFTGDGSGIAAHAVALVERMEI